MISLCVFSKHFTSLQSGYYLMSLKVSEMVRVSCGALLFALHLVEIIRAAVKCQRCSCGWPLGVRGRDVPFLCTIYPCKCAAPAGKMDIELIISVICNMTSVTWRLTSQNDSARAPANFMPMQLQLGTNYKSLGVFFLSFILYCELH